MQFGTNPLTFLNFRSNKPRLMNTFQWIFSESRTIWNFKEKMTQRIQSINLTSRKLSRLYKSTRFKPNDKMWKGASSGFKGPPHMGSGFKGIFHFSSLCRHTAITFTKTIRKYRKIAFIGNSKVLCITMQVKYAWSWPRNTICWMNSDSRLSLTEWIINYAISTLSVFFWKMLVILKSKGPSL